MSDQGVLMTTVASGTNLTEKAMGLPLALIRVVRDEVSKATFAGVDWAEGVNQAAFKIVRETLKGVDKLSQEAVDGLDSIAGAITITIRGTSEAAGEMVSKTTAALTATKLSTEKGRVAAA